jgi:hypothetical protein
MTKEILTHIKLFETAKKFCLSESASNFPELKGITDGKNIGSFVEKRLKDFLSERFNVEIGNSASGLDFPSLDINTDLKVTSCQQPQSSCPYKSSRQKIFGLGYNLLVIIYDKKDSDNTSYMNYLNCTFVEDSRTSDYTMTKRLSEMLKDGCNHADIVAYFFDKGIFGDDIALANLADEVLNCGVKQGYLTISNALQWRLQYGRVISLSNSVSGVFNYDFN